MSGWVGSGGSFMLAIAGEASNKAWSDPDLPRGALRAVRRDLAMGPLAHTGECQKIVPPDHGQRRRDGTRAQHSIHRNLPAQYTNTTVVNTPHPIGPPGPRCPMEKG